MKFVIEFRSGSFFQNLEADHGGKSETAQQFATYQEVVKFMNANDWIYLNGGMVVDAPKKSSSATVGIMIPED